MESSTTLSNVTDDDDNSSPSAQHNSTHDIALMIIGFVYGMRFNRLGKKKIT